jgi:two-component system, OmpR family, response regulator
VLVVDDDTRMSALLRRGLAEEGYAVDVAGEGGEAVWLATENDYDTVVLDLMLPGLDGYEVCRRLRGAGRWAPVLMLTARDGVVDRVRGLDAVPTTTWSSRSASRSWQPGFGRCFGAAPPSARRC